MSPPGRFKAVWGRGGFQDVRSMARVEAELRFLDRPMPEEMRRVIADRISELSYSPTRLASGSKRMENAIGHLAFVLS